jgi:hypothetical protein
MPRIKFKPAKYKMRADSFFSGWLRKAEEEEDTNDMAQSINARVKDHENNGVGARQQRLHREDAQDVLLMQEPVNILRLRLVLPV